MKHACKQFMALTGLTALEAIRQPVCLLVATACIGGITLVPILLTHTMGESQKMVMDSALAFFFVCGMILAGYAACATLTREIRSGTVYTILSKPVGRGLFFLSKFMGVALVLLAFSLACILSAMLSARMAAEDFFLDWWAGGPLLAVIPSAFLLAGIRNYITRRPFSSAAFFALVLCVGAAFVGAGWTDSHGHRVPFGALYTWDLVPAGLLITLAILTLCALAVSLATKFDALPNLSLCTLAFLTGLMSDYLFGRHAASSRVAATLYRLIPNWQHFWVMDALHSGQPIPWRYVAFASLYAALFIAGLLCMGMGIFRQTEVNV